MNIVATIEARMTSSRLPGKVMLPALGEPMIGHLIRRLKSVPSINDIVVATTVNKTDDVLVDFLTTRGVKVFRGSELDVMGRVIGAGESAHADILVEITGDCPIIDPDIVEQTVRTFLANTATYVANNHIKSFPDGMDTQVFPLSALQKSAAMTTAPIDREHVSLHIRRHPELFPHIYLVAPPSLHSPELGLTLDEPADYEFIKALIEKLTPKNRNFGCRDVLDLIRDDPSLRLVNQHVQRKGDA